MEPLRGDVLVSRVTARVEHEVLILPERTGSMCASHDAAVAHACDLARQMHVDVWLTEDHTHFMRIASYRAAPPAPE